MRPHLEQLPHNDIVIDGKRYMRRYWLARTRLFEVRIHHIRLPDAGRDVHDHPFDFATFVLKGWYWEQLGDGSLIRHRRFLPHFRQAEIAHTIIDVPRPAGVWTLVVTGPRRREWGFYVDGKWIHEHHYHQKVM